MGKIVLFSMLIIAMLSVMVAAGSGEKKSKGNNVGFGSTFTNAAKGNNDWIRILFSLELSWAFQIFIN